MDSEQACLAARPAMPTDPPCRQTAMPTGPPCRQAHKLKLAHCRGIRRIVQCLNMLLRVQAPDEQYLDIGQHGSLLHAKFNLT